MKSDAEIRRSIESELQWDPDLDQRGICVAVCRGVVSLSGEVTSHDSRWTAEEIAACVSDVRGVVNEIVVKTAHPLTTDTGGAFYMPDDLAG